MPTKSTKKHVAKTELTLPLELLDTARKQEHAIVERLSEFLPTTPDAMKIREDIHSYLSTLYMAHHLLREQVSTTGWYRIARIRSLIEKGASAEATLTAISRVVDTPIYAKGRGKRLEGK